jgi:aspartate/methionine/tyrosine aminotransferase
MAGITGAEAEVFSRYTAQARALGSVNLAQGIPEGRLDDSLGQALLDSLGLGWQYVDPRGLERLRIAIASRVYAGAFRTEEVLITSGCTESVTIALQSLAGRWSEDRWGAKVAFLEPFYPYYPGFAELAGFEPVPIPMHDGPPALDLDAIERVFSNGVRILLLNTPHNPSGWVITSDEAHALRGLLERYGVFLILDDAYHGFVYSGADSAGAARLVESNERLLVAGSCSKLLSATGLRLGWLLGTASALKRAHALHMYLTYCQPGPLQGSAATLIEQRRPADETMLAAHYERKRDSLVAALRAAGMSCSSPRGSHFVVADYSRLAPRVAPEDFALEFARTVGVMSLPLTPFCAPGSAHRRLRFSFSVDQGTLDSAVDRMTEGAGRGL